ncbi:MAG: response regulator transcription factor [Desulfobacterium sp.]|nr:response regulator transcription factor [Desulfobacteraceae bacterium]MBA3036894.1 response regulator transcription factor [Desulfobacterium sp.]
MIKKRIVIIDDHPLFREGLKSIIGRSSQYEVVGEASTGTQGLKIIKELGPDLVLTDMSLPDQSGIELIGNIKSYSAEIHVMVVSMHSEIDFIVRAFQAGATGYVIKDSASDILLQGIENVLNGQTFMDTSVSREVVKKLSGLPEKEKIVGGANYDNLTPREQQVMVLLAEGLSANQVADKLFISPKTVDNHRTNIMHKLGLKRTFEMIRYAAKLGLIDVDLWKG